MKLPIFVKFFIAVAVLVYQTVYYILYYHIFSKYDKNIETEYETLNNQWQAMLLSEDFYDELNLKDPRRDDDALRPVLNHDNVLITIHDFSNEAKGFLLGEGWQLTGAIVDVITRDGFNYILYGRENERYIAGLWNNSVDLNRSFYDYFVVKRKGNQAEILVYKRLIPNTSQILIGLRHTPDDDGFEVIQNWPNDPRAIWLYRF
jgi:hypothetical protein